MKRCGVRARRPFGLGEALSLTPPTQAAPVYVSPHLRPALAVCSEWFGALVRLLRALRVPFVLIDRSSVSTARLSKLRGALKYQVISNYIISLFFIIYNLSGEIRFPAA